MARTILTTETTPNLTTGVLNANCVDGWFFHEEGPNPEYEAAVAKARLDAYQEAIDEGNEADADQAADEAEEELANSWDSSSYSLYGDWRKSMPDGKYEPDPEGKQGFAAIFNRDTNTIQVVWSKHYMECHQCSPCYPLQGDLDTPGDHYTCYALPPSMMSEGWLAEHQSRYMDEEDRNFKN